MRRAIVLCGAPFLIVAVAAALRLPYPIEAGIVFGIAVAVSFVAVVR